jgi:hypothetical protein
MRKNNKEKITRTWKRRGKKERKLKDKKENKSSLIGHGNLNQQGLELEEHHHDQQRHTCESQDACLLSNRMTLPWQSSENYGEI